MSGAGAIGLSAAMMIAGLLVVALTEDWPGRTAGVAVVAGGSVALATSRWRTRIIAWIAAAVGVIVVLQVRR